MSRSTKSYEERLLQNEKEKKKRADSTIEECQDKLRQAEREKGICTYASEEIKDTG